jgi:FkbM family methyltransferase
MSFDSRAGRSRHNPARGDIRLRYYRQIWVLLWPLRAYLHHFPLNRGKSLLIRTLMVPLLPPAPALFAHRVPGGDQIELGYREELGLTVLLGGDYLDCEAAVAAEQVSSGGWIVDAGANIGLTVLQFSRRADRVIALEPSPPSVARLRRNLELNGVTHVEIVEAAVGAQAGQVTFHESRSHTLSSASMIPANHTRSYTVSQTTLDGIWKEAGRPAVSLIKLDIEGGECDALRGAGNLIESQKPAILVEALTGHELEQIADLLRPLGYDRQQPAGFDSFNYLFLVC